MEAASVLGLTDLVGVLSGLFVDLGAVAPNEHIFSDYWRPISSLSYLAAAWLSSGEAWGFRLIALVLLAVLAWAASREVRLGYGRDLVLLLVVLHPMMSAAVVDISGIPLLLCAVFGVLAVTSPGAGAFFYTLLAVGSHEAAAVTPLIAMTLSRDSMGQRRPHSRWTLALGAVAVWWLVSSLMVLSGVISIEAVSVPTADSLVEAGAQAWFYIERLLLPFSPLFIREAPAFEAPWPALAWAGLLVALWLAIRVRFERSEPAGPGFSAGFTCIVTVLLAAGGMLSESAGYGEDRLVLPIVGLAWMLASRPPTRVAAWTLVPLFGTLTVLRVGVWADPVALWAESHKARPNDAVVSLGYGQRIITTDPGQAVGLFASVIDSASSDDAKFRAHVGSIQAYFELNNERGALPHLAAVADPNDPNHGWLLVRRCILETRYSVDEAHYADGKVKSPLVRVCGEAASRYPMHARLANAAGIEAAIRGDTERAQAFIQRAVELAPGNSEYRETFARIPMHTLGWGMGELLSPDPAAAP